MKKAWLEDGAMPVVEGGYLKGCGQDIYVGIPVTIMNETGNPARAPKAKRIFFPLFEVACNPTVIGRKDFERKTLARKGEEVVRRDLARKESDLAMFGLGVDVWVIFKQDVTTLNADDGLRMGVVSFCQVAMFGVALCLRVWDERRGRR